MECIEKINISEEINWYKYYITKGERNKLFLAICEHQPILQIARWQKYSRLSDFYEKRKSKNIIYKILFLYYTRKKNILGQSLGLDLSTIHIGQGLKILHYNITINGNAIIGNNLRLLGSNVIGNGGPNKLGCPIIGNDVIMGAGAKVLGPVCIADGITIAAGAIVVNTFTEKGITIAGVPAKKIK